MDWQDWNDWMIVDQALSKATATHYQRRIRGLLTAERLHEAELHPDQIEKAARRVLAAKLRSDISNGGYNQYVAAFNALAAYLGTDVTFAYRRQEDPKVRALDDDQLDQLWAWSHPGDNDFINARGRAIIALSLVTGARMGELYKLCASDLDLDQQTVQIRHPTKGAKRRILPVGRWLFSPRRPVGAYLNRAPVPEDHGSIWVAEDGRSLAKKTFEKILPSIGNDLGFPLNWQITRHTCATRLRLRGANLLAIKEWLGHRDISSTQIYAAVGQDELANRDDLSEPDPTERG